MTKRTIVRALLALFLIFFSICGICGSAFGAPANAATNVLEDLQKDRSFDLAKYPAIYNDYSLEVIQIAESVNNELYLYVYQPSGEQKQLTASFINMALSEDVDKTKLYNLTLLNQTGVFQKYRVDGVKVLYQETRHYNISSISRPWDKELDEDPDAEKQTDNEVNYKAYKVAKLFKVQTVNNDLVYTYEGTKVVTIVNPFADTLRYSDGKFPFVYDQKSSDFHYIAFATDIQIDKLKSVKLTYTKENWYDNYEPFTHPVHPNQKGHNDESITTTIYATEKVHSDADGILGKYYEFDSIMTVEKFKDNANLKKETIEQLTGTQWVLLFLKTTYIEREYGQDIYKYWVEVHEATILELNFVTRGKNYSLGTVADTVTADKNFGNTDTDSLAGFWEWIARLLKVPEWLLKLLTVIPVIIVVAILAMVFPAFGSALLAIIKIIGKIISAPFKGIAKLIEKRKNKPKANTGSKAPKKKSRTSTRKKTSGKRTAKK